MSIESASAEPMTLGMSGFLDEKLEMTKAASYAAGNAVGRPNTSVRATRRWARIVVFIQLFVD